MHVSNQLPIANDEWKYNGLSYREMKERVLSWLTVVAKCINLLII